MKSVILKVNSGHVRHAPHQGVICTDIRVTVFLMDTPPVEHNGKQLRTVMDSVGEQHLVDEFFLEGV